MHFVNYVYAWFHVVTEVLCMSGVVQCTNSKQSDHTILQVDDRLQEVKNNGKL